MGIATILFLLTESTNVKLLIIQGQRNGRRVGALTPLPLPLWKYGGAECPHNNIIITKCPCYINNCTMMMLFARQSSTDSRNIAIPKYSSQKHSQRV